MPRLIDADKLEPSEIYMDGGFTQIVYMDDIDEMPTVDAVEVIRCKDCRHQWHTNYIKVPICGKMSEDGHEIHAEDDFYCAKGERRE